MVKEIAPRQRRSLPDQVKASSEKKIEREAPYTAQELLSTGSTLLDLACSDITGGGFRMGRLVNLIGDSSSGKTLLCLTVLAEACNDKRFDDYRIIFDDAEAAQSFDIARLFGEALADRMEAPHEDEEGEPIGSDTVQQFQYHTLKALDGDRPVIYVLDSFDALSSDEEISRVDDAMTAYDKGNKPKGTYAMEKAKIGGRALAMICRKLKKTKSLIVIISQTRDNIDPVSFQKKTRSGGKALKFYATHEIWLACGKKISKKERVVGINAICKISKNKLTGKSRQVEFPVYYDYGVDDIGSSVDFMVKEGYWKKTGNTINAEELGLSGTRDKLIRDVEDEGHERKLKRAVGKAWAEIEESLRLGRKSRYS